MLQINKIKPVFNKIVTTCNTYSGDENVGGIVIKTKGSIKEYQTVEAVGSTVRDVKVGDIIKINPTRYVKQHHNNKGKSSLANVIEDQVSFTVEFPVVEYGGKKYLLLYDQDVDYIIEGEETEKSEPSLVLPEKKKIIV